MGNERIVLQKGSNNPIIATLLVKPQKDAIWYATGSHSLNLALNFRGQGIKGGNAVELAGEPATGKTLISLKLAESAQKKGGVAFFIDVEGRLNMEFAKSLGVDLDNLYYYGPTKTAKVDGELQKVSLTLDNVFTIINNIFVDMAKPENEKIPFVIVLDSLGMLNSERDLGMKKTSENAYKTEDGGKPKGDQGMRAKSLRGWINKVGPQVQSSQGLLVLLNHLYSSTDGYSNQPNTRGGRAPKYLASVRIFFTKVGDSVVRNKDEDSIGEIIHAYIKKSSIGRPYQKTTIKVVFGDEGEVHLDNYWGLPDYLKRKGFLVQSGSWYKILGTNFNWQGQEAVVAALNSGELKWTGGELIGQEIKTK